MKINIVIEGERGEYDLSIVHHLNNLSLGDVLITTHPETKTLVRAHVVGKSATGIHVEDAADIIVPHRWYIPEKHLNEKVYKIDLLL